MAIEFLVNSEAMQVALGVKYHAKLQTGSQLAAVK